MVESRSASTWNTYRAACRAFERYCEEAGAEPWERCATTAAETIARFVRASHLKPQTLAGYVAAIKAVRRLRQLPPADEIRVALALAAARRRRGVGAKRAPALGIDQLRGVISRIGRDLPGARDRAMILLGWAAALRVSEIVGLTTQDVRFDDAGLVLTIRRSKTDQDGVGAEVYVPMNDAEPMLCAVRALRALLDAVAAQFRHASQSGERLFVSIARSGRLGHSLSTEGARKIIKRRFRAAGLTEHTPHSLRAGCVTAMAGAGIALAESMAHSPHRSVQVHMGYVRRPRGLADSPLRAVFAKAEG